jgi:hypothetical protein
VPYNGCCNRAGKGDPRSPGQKKHSNSHNQIEEKTGAKRPKNQPQGFNMEDQLYPKKGRYFLFFPPKRVLCTIGYRPNNYMIEDVGHSWGTHLKNCLGAVFQLGFNKASYYLENLAFSGL